jgi:cytochrome P450
MLDALGAGSAVSTVVSWADVDQAKPDPDIIERALAESGTVRREAVMAGDTAWDVIAARRARLPCIGLLPGGITAEQLREAGAAEVYPDAAAYSLLDRLRAQRWLVASPLGYTVIGYPEAREIKRDPDIVRIVDAVDAERSALLHRKAAENISSQGGARLVQLRKIIVQALRPRQVAVYRQGMSSIAHELLDRISDTRRADLVAEFAGPYPGLVMSPLMGVPFAETVELDEWASIISELGNHSRYDDRIPVIEAAWRSMEAYLGDLITAPAARRRPGPRLMPACASACSMPTS